MGLLALLPLLVLAFLALPGCLVRKLKVIRPGVSSSAKLQTATLEQLVEKLRAWDQQIKTISLTADLEPSIGSVLKGEISELKDVRSFVLIRKPETIRMIGLYPVVRNRAFDMVSDGVDFKLHVPARNKFIVGKNRLEHPSPRKLENLRPQHIFEALLVRPLQEGERALLENDTDELHADYILHVVKEKAGRLSLARNIWFNREHLRVSRQEIFDENGDIVSDARYDDYHNTDGIAFPRRFSVMRPRDEYGLKLTVLKIDLNIALGDDKFALAQPPGTELMNLPAPNPGAPAGNDEPARNKPPAADGPPPRNGPPSPQPRGGPGG